MRKLIYYFTVCTILLVIVVNPGKARAAELVWWQDYEDGFDGGEPFTLSGGMHNNPCGNITTRNFGGSRALYAETTVSNCSSNPIRLYRSYHAGNQFPLPILITFWFYVDAPDWQTAAGDRFSQLTAKEHSGAGSDVERLLTTHVLSDGTIDCGHCSMSYRSTLIKTPLRKWNLQSAYIENSGGQTHVTLWVDDKEAVRGVVNNHWYEGYWRDGHYGMYADREGGGGPFSMYNDNIKYFKVSSKSEAREVIARELGGEPIPTTPPTTPTPTPASGPTSTPTPTPGSGSNKFQVGDRVEVIAEANVKSTAGGGLLGTQPAGARGTVLGGPDIGVGGQHWWWEIDYDNWPDGWSREDLLREIGISPTNTPTANPSNTPVPTPTPIPGDIDLDGDVDQDDYGILVGEFSKIGSSLADIDKDNDVDIFDYSILVENYGGVAIPTLTPTGSSAAWGDYFVDAVGGNDSNSGRSQTDAWKTIGKVSSSSFSPGDTILFRRGQTWNEVLYVSSSGAVGNPITFAAYGTGAKPRMYAVRDNNTTNPDANPSGRLQIVIDNLELANYSVAKQFGSVDIRSQQSNNWTIQNSIIRDGTGGAGVFTRAHNTVIRNNKISGFKSAERNRTCIWLDRIEVATTPGNEVGAKNAIIDNNELTNCDIGLSPETGTHTITNNDVHHNMWNGISAYSKNPNIRDLVITYNRVHDNGQASNVGDSTNWDGAWLRISNSLIAYNLFYDNKRHGLHLDDTARDNKIYNNVFYGHHESPGVNYSSGLNLEDGCTEDGSNCSTRSGLTTGNIIKNNIGFNNNQHFALSDDTGAPGANTFDYNLWDENSGSIGWVGYKSRDALTIEQWRSLTGQGTHSISANPRFINAAAGDFSLQSGSPAINAGTNVGLTQDITGNQVPVGAAPEMGAYEFGF